MAKKKPLIPIATRNPRRPYTIRKISTTVKYSRELPTGDWKSVELFASATVGEHEDPQVAHLLLYEELADTLRRVFFQPPNGQE